MPTIERQGTVSVPYTTKYPKVIGGHCERHGVIDPMQPAIEQYKLCGCFPGVDLLRCSYCDESRNPNEVIYSSTINVHGKPGSPNELVAVCDNFDCSQKHLARFKLSKS